MGGVPGQIRLLNLNNKNSITSIDTYTNVGKTGQSGDNVIPCMTKKYLYSHRYFDEKTTYLWMIHKNKKECVISPRTEHEDNTNCSDQRNYASYNQDGRKFPLIQPTLDIYTPLIDYKKYLRENMHVKNPFRNFQSFYKEIDENNDLNDEYKIEDFIKELKSYESHFFALKDQIDFLSLYGRLKNRLDQYGQRTVSSSSNRKTLTWLYTSVLSRQYSLRMEREPIIVTDISAHFNGITSKIQRMNNLNKRKMIEDYKNSYKNEMNVKIREAESFINEQILSTIDEYTNSIEKEIDVLLAEIFNRDKQTLQNVIQMKKDQEVLNRNMRVGRIFCALRMVGAFASAFLPFGRLIEAGVDKSTKVAESLLISNVSPVVVTTSTRSDVPPAVRDNFERSYHAINERTLRKINAVTYELDKLEVNAKKDTRVSGTIWDVKLDELATNVKSALKLQQNSLTPDLKTVNDLSDRIKMEIIQRSKDYIDKNEPEIAEIFETTSKALLVIDASIDTYQRQKQISEDRINEIADQIASANAEFEMYRNYEEQVYSKLMPMVDGAREQFKDFENGLNNKSHASLDISQWAIKRQLKDLELDLVTMVKGFDAEPNIVRCIRDLSESFEMLIDIYDRVQSYADQQKLAIYIGEVNQAGLKQIHYDDEKLNAAMVDLELSMSSSIILAQYYNSIHMFKQIVFPFAESYLIEYTLPTDLKSEKNVTALADVAVQHLELLSQRILEFNMTAINHNDKLIHSGYFSGNPSELKPFYLWKRSEHGNVIDNLLKGKKISIRAEVRHQNVQNAVKFNVVGVQFRTENETILNNLKTALNEFHISMHHSGMSHYRCDHHYYKVNGPSLDINYSFKHRNDEPVSKNAVYAKLRSGNIIVSPYTLWTMQLTHGDFETLRAFEGLFDMELYGHGQYIPQNVKICEKHLERFYTYLDDELTGVLK